jgi:hypothetical protein
MLKKRRGLYENNEILDCASFSKKPIFLLHFGIATQVDDRDL